jgi:Transposase DNA-binding/Transposase DDE domain
MSHPFSLSLGDSRAWADATFSGSPLGDARNTRRLVKIAAAVSRRPAGRVTQVFEKDADRQAAYGLLENERVRAADILRGLGETTAQQCVTAGMPRVYVAGDGSSIRVTDRKGTKGSGRVGTTQAKGRGFEVMSGLAIDPDGVPRSLCWQSYWARTGALKKKSHKKRKLEDKETKHCIQFMRDMAALFDAASEGAEVRCVPCALLDRGYDARDVLAESVALRGKLDTIVRAAYNRRVADPVLRYLWEALERRSALCSYTLNVPAGPKRQARTARMEVRASEVTLRLLDPWTKKESFVTLNAVLTREVGTTPVGEKPIVWFLLTTLPVDDAEQACAVIDAYSFRWRIEEFHRAWKSGLCCVEDNELRSPEAIQKWAIVLATVAVRAVHLARAARTTPDLPAAAEFTDDEIEATIVLRQPKGVSIEDRPPLHLVVRWIADLGGYTGKSSGGPPGPTVIGRGLLRMEAAACAIKNLRQMQSGTQM